MKISLQNYLGSSLTGRAFQTFVLTIVWGVFVAVAGASSLHAQVTDAAKLEQLHEIRMKQIPLLESFIKKYPRSPKVADSIFRLGEAYFETAKYYQLKKVSSRSKNHFNKAISTLKSLEKTYPRYKRLDEAMFVMANAYREKGDVTQAGTILSRVASSFPDSPVLQEASLLLGDHHFKRREFSKARRHYQNALKRKDVQPYVHYKLAWVAINRHQPAVSLKHFEKVLELSGKVSSVDYSKEAAREISYPAVQVYSTKRVMGYLEKVLGTGELLESSVETLAKLLTQKEETKKASKIYDQLIARFPQSEKKQDWVSAQITLEEKLGNSKKIVGLVSKLHGSSDSKKVQSQLLKSAKKHHALAQKEKDATKKSSNYEQAATYYQAFLEIADDNAIKWKSHFYLGEVLFELAQYKKASKNYEIAASKESDLRAKAAWNWYLTNEKLVTGFNYSGKDFKSTSETDNLFIKSANYLQNVPGISLEQKRKASYQSARLLYQLNDYDRALPVFKHIAESYPSSKVGRLSKQLVLDIHNLRQDYSKVAQYAAHFRKKSDSGEQRELRKIEEKALLKQIEDNEKEARRRSGDAKWSALKQVAGQYLKFVQRYPTSTFADKSLFTSLKTFAKVASEQGDRDFPELQKAFDLLIAKYPKSSYRAKAVMLVGEFLAYEEIEDASILRKYAAHRPAWYKKMRAQPAKTSGLWGMLVYRLSDSEQRDQLEKRFARWPVTEDNRKAVALGRLDRLEKVRDQVYAVKLDSLKSLGAKTKKKIALLEKLQKDTTAIVDLKVGRVAVSALQILAQGYYNVADALMEAPIPTVLKGEDRQKYKNAVAERASKLRNKGKDAARLAKKTAANLSI